MAVWSVAAGPPPKSESVTLTTSIEGSQVLLTATILKHGSDYTDSWEGAVSPGTVLNSDGYYVSTATFTASGSGDFLVTYSITMTAGESDVVWEGTASVGLEVTINSEGEALIKPIRCELK